MKEKMNNGKGRCVPSIESTKRLILKTLFFVEKWKILNLLIVYILA